MTHTHTKHFPLQRMKKKNKFGDKVTKLLLQIRFSTST